MSKKIYKLGRYRIKRNYDSRGNEEYAIYKESAPEIYIYIYRECSLKGAIDTCKRLKNLDDKDLKSGWVTEDEVRMELI